MVPAFGPTWSGALADGCCSPTPPSHIFDATALQPGLFWQTPTPPPVLQTTYGTPHCSESLSPPPAACVPVFPSERKYYMYHMQRLQTTANHVLFYVRA